MPTLKLNVLDSTLAQQLRRELGPSLHIEVEKNGYVKAASRLNTSGDPCKDDPTNYDAVWVRDSVWAYLALEELDERRQDAHCILKMLQTYFLSAPQINRFQMIIENPALLKSPQSHMLVPHIRFDFRSPDFLDVKINGLDQEWNHKQNDALGFFLLEWIRSLKKWPVARDELIEIAALFVSYFKKIKFWAMEDAGPWEEIDRLNTSSVALISNALEELIDYLDAAPDLWQAFSQRCLELGHEPLDKTEVLSMLDHGYDRIFKNLNLGGESPDYPANHTKRRLADAALYYLCFPCRLSRLKVKDYLKIIHINRVLIGEMGIKRYLGDTYQCAGYWEKLSNPTEDFSSDESFEKRALIFQKDTEAQWFFDSWLSKIYAKLYKIEKVEEFKQKQLKHLNRALTQQTPPTQGGKYPLGADHNPVSTEAFPESYNVVSLHTNDSPQFLPSPITPLNWAKASLSIAITEIEQSAWHQS